MTYSNNSSIPLSKDELIKLKHQIDPNNYKVIEKDNSRILIIRSPNEYPDIVNDLEIMINKFDLRDTDGLSIACIIGDAEVIGVSISAIKSLISRRIEDDEKIAIDLADKLEEPYSSIIFESEDDPLNAIRLGIRVPGKLEEYKPQELQQNLFSKMKSLPRNGEIIYIISDDGYVRINGKDFYSQLTEFLRENPDRNKELTDEYIDRARGTIAEFFLGKEPIKTKDEISYQKQINTYAQEPKKDQPLKNIDVIEERMNSVDNIEETTKVDKGSDEVNEEMLKELSKSKKNGIPIIDRVKHEEEIDTFGRFEPSNSETTSVASLDMSPKEDFLNKLQKKLSKSNYSIISGITIPGVDIVANDPLSIVKKVFFCYMPKFDLKEALALERSLDKFHPEHCLLIGPKEDTDLKIFIVGKNIQLVDTKTILNTDYLDHLEG